MLRDSVIARLRENDCGDVAQILEQSSHDAVDELIKARLKTVIDSAKKKSKDLGEQMPLIGKSTVLVVFHGR